jgi:hypothetical protein
MASKYGRPIRFRVGFPGFFFYTHKEVGSTMKQRIAVGGFLAVAVLASTVIAADAVKSGPQPGDTVRTPFDVRNVSGPYAPQTLCLV